MTSLFLITGFFSFAQGSTFIDSIISGSVYRKFRIYVPAVYSASKAAPLILDLHGYTSNAIQEQLYSNFMPIADTAGFITAYPEGLAPFGGAFWNAGITNMPNDVQFMNDLMSYCQSRYNIDDRRIYSCGMSNGAIMSYYLACNAPNRITAIASVTGTMFNAWFGQCQPDRAIPVMEIHGTSDGTVPYNGDSNFAPIDSVIKKWVKHNNCNLSPVTFTVPDINSLDNSYAVNYRYHGGTNGSSVELYKIVGGSHSWPGAANVFANTNQDFNASVEIWRFFRRYRLNQFISNVGWQEQALENSIVLYPNPSASSIYLKGLQGGTHTIFTFDGKQVSNASSSETIDLGGFEKGIYLMQVVRNNITSTVKFLKE